MALVSRFLLVAAVSVMVVIVKSKKTGGINVIDDVVEFKEFKKLLRTKTNVLTLFAQSGKEASKTLDIFYEVADIIKGQGTLVYIDCSGEAKKVCKKLKVNPQPIALKHYKDGEYHKDYDRKDTVQSMTNFMRDPSGDAPWDEDSSNGEIVHVADAISLGKLFRKENKPVLVMFYAPWCGFCKRMKPLYLEAATELKGHSILAAMDANKPENAGIRQHFNITGFPTLLYFVEGKMKYKYEGENTKEGIVNFLKNPSEPPPKPKDDWSEEPSSIAHLTEESFDAFLAMESSVLVMFYAPWCGHCKAMKPEYADAAAKLAEDEIPGRLAAVDATKDGKLAARFSVKGYPTVKYFKNGELAFDVPFRTADKILEFMKDPQEPPPPPPPEQPWHEMETDVEHLTDDTFKTFLRKKKHALVMFYAPWCGFCKKAKPEFEAAAAQFKEEPKVAFAAVDCTLHSALCSEFEVKGYPTIKYFNYFKNVTAYDGERTESGFVAFMKDPQNPIPPKPSHVPDQEQWKDLEGAENLHHLTEQTFEEFVSTHESVLVMFHAPWCGHCKLMKPAFAEAASLLKKEKVAGFLASVDATVERGLQSQFGIRGYPTLKYFRNGKEAGDYDRERSAVGFVNFMKNPTTSTNNKDEL